MTIICCIVEQVSNWMVFGKLTSCIRIFRYSKILFGQRSLKSSWKTRSWLHYIINDMITAGLTRQWDRGPSTKIFTPFSRNSSVYPDKFLLDLHITWWWLSARGHFVQYIYNVWDFMIILLNENISTYFLNQCLCFQKYSVKTYSYWNKQTTREWPLYHKNPWRKCVSLHPSPCYDYL